MKEADKAATDHAEDQNLKKKEGRRVDRLIKEAGWKEHRLQQNRL